MAEQLINPISSTMFVTAAMLPCFLFMAVSIPVERRSLIQEIVLFILLSFGLCTPVYFAGKLPYVCLMSTSVWSWATSMKMGVWLFSMTMEERRLCPFALTILAWRKKRILKGSVVEEEKTRDRSSNMNITLAPFVLGKIKHILISDVSETALHLCDVDMPVRFFSAFVYKSLSYLGLPATDTGFPLTLSNFIHSTAICMVFAVYLQMQLELTYDVFMILFILMHKIASVLEKWQLTNYSKEKHTQNISRAKNTFKRIQKIRAVKTYLEETIFMPPAFDSPWSAHSLRDFWGRRWHTYYNDCFYRLGYQPIRFIVQLVSGRKAPRWLPALSVFVMSGLMHEYFLYVSVGHTLYFHGSPLQAGFFQFTFFVSQVFFISIGDKYCKDGPLGKVHAFASMIVTCHMFVVPYVMSGYTYMPRFSFNRTIVNLYRGAPSILDPIF